MWTSLIRSSVVPTLMALFASALVPGSVIALSPDRTPKQAILFEDSKRIIARNAWNSLALYLVSDGSIVHRFPASTSIEKIALTADETRLLVGCRDGTIFLWDIETGNELWKQTTAQTSLDSIDDLAFAHDGESCVCVKSRAVILQTRTGAILATVPLTPGNTTIRSAALSPDGRTCALVDWDDRLFTFEVSTGRLTNTGITGFLPVRYSVDGKFIAFGFKHADGRERLRCVAMDGTFAQQDFGQFSYIARIKPAMGGTFLATAKSGGASDAVIAVQVSPATGKYQVVWSSDFKVTPLMDFNPQSMVAVSTFWRLRTYVTDLRTKTTLLSINNSAHDEPMATFPIYLIASGKIPGLWLLLILLGLPAIGLLLYFWYRKVRNTALAALLRSDLAMHKQSTPGPLNQSTQIKQPSPIQSPRDQG